MEPQDRFHGLAVDPLGAAGEPLGDPAGLGASLQGLEVHLAAPAIHRHDRDEAATHLDAALALYSKLGTGRGISTIAAQPMDELAASGKVQAYGAGRARRWMTPPLPVIATTLLLPAPLPGD